MGLLVCSNDRYFKLLNEVGIWLGTLRHQKGKWYCCNTNNICMFNSKQCVELLYGCTFNLLLYVSLNIKLTFYTRFFNFMCLLKFFKWSFVQAFVALQLLIIKFFNTFALSAFTKIFSLHRVVQAILSKYHQNGSCMGNNNDSKKGTISYLQTDIFQTWHKNPSFTQNSLYLFNLPNFWKS